MNDILFFFLQSWDIKIVSLHDFSVCVCVCVRACVWVKLFPNTSHQISITKLWLTVLAQWESMLYTLFLFELFRAVWLSPWNSCFECLQFRTCISNLGNGWKLAHIHFEPENSIQEIWSWTDGRADCRTGDSNFPPKTLIFLFARPINIKRKQTLNISEKKGENSLEFHMTFSDCFLTLFCYSLPFGIVQLRH